MQSNTKIVSAKNSFLLLLTATIWGVAFVAQRVGMDYMGPFAFSAIRFTMGGLVLLPVALLLRSKKKRDGGTCESLRTTLIGGVACGIVLCVASNLQQFGVKYTTVGKAGFITALYIIFVPIIGLFLKKRAGVKLWISVVIAVVGLYLLCMTDRLTLTGGDTLILLSAVVFSLHILAIDYFAPRADGVLMSCIQFFVSGVLSFFAMLPTEAMPSLGLMQEAWVPVVYAGVLSCGVAYTLQIVGQKGMDPTVASLILSLESVIAVLAGWLILGQSMSARELCGAVLMFGAILLAQFPERARKESADTI